MAAPSKSFLFDWEVLDVVISGQSAIDSEEGLRIRTTDDALKFLDCYGFDLENPIERAELFGHFHEAVSFIRRFFLFPQNPDGLKLEIPRKIAELTDPAQVLVLANQPPQQQSQIHLWACAIMKIMHTISHMDKDLRSHYFTDIQKQILDRVYRNIHNEDGQIFLGRKGQNGNYVELVQFETKPKKSRDSILLKLLHKPENVAEELFDRVGIRFVTKTKFDAIRIVKFLKDHYVIMPANIKPSRSRNTLIDMPRFKEEWAALLQRAQAQSLSDQALYEAAMSMTENLGQKDGQDNPHSSKDYKSIQFTCRQLIKIRNPLYDDLKQLKGAPKNSGIPDDLSRVIENLDLRSIQKETRFFYPYEVQVTDEKSHADNLEGSSAHSAYKKSQIQAAMKRVMRGLV